MPTCSTPKICVQIRAITSSVGVRGETNSLSTVRRLLSGAGKALRLSFPLVVSGKASRNTNTDGSMYIGKRRSEEHTSELQSHSFISYAVFCLKKKNNK